MNNGGVERLYFILGCTACGKGAVGRELARRLGAQILSVDSMKIYRRMDIGTAKPPPEVRAEIPHHGLDLVEPGAGFSVAEYVRYADGAIEAIRKAGAIALAVGGTSLYIKAVSEGLFEGPPTDVALRAQLLQEATDKGLPALHTELARVDPPAAGHIHVNDRKRIIRALEVWRSCGTPISTLQKQWDAGALRYDCVFIGLTRPKEDLHRRINLRAKRMIDAGLRDEVAALLAEPAGLSPQAAQAVGYAEMIEHLRGRLTLEEAQERVKINTRQLAKKQRTWQRRFAGVQWFDLSPDSTPQQAADRILAEIQFGV